MKINNMKKNVITIVVAALVGGLTAFAVSSTTLNKEHTGSVVTSPDGSSYRTVNLNLSDYPDFTYAAESAVDAVVYVKVTVQSQAIQGPSSIFDFFFGQIGRAHV